MSGVKGKKRENLEFSKQVGYAECKILCFNPTMEELAELLPNADINREPEYLDENYELKDKDGEVLGVYTRLKLNVWIESIKTKQKFNLRFYLTDLDRQNKEETKYQYINRKGWTSWADSENNLQEWFTEKGEGNWRVAKRGEEAFANFFSTSLGLDYRDPDATALPDLRKLFKGNVKELNTLVKEDMLSPVICMLTVQTSDGDDGPVDYQSVYNGAFLPGNWMKYLRVGGGSEFVKKTIKKFKEKIEDPEHGCKDFYFMGEMKDYDPTENVPAGDATISQEGADYDVDED